VVTDAFPDGRVFLGERGEEELDEGDVRYSVGEGAEGGGVEALQDERGGNLGARGGEGGGGGAHAEVFGLEDLDDFAFDVEAVEVEEVRLFDLGVDPHFAFHCAFGFADHVDDFVESRDLEEAIVGATPLTQSLLGPQRLDLRQGKIKGEKAVHGNKGGEASHRVPGGNARGESDVAAPVGEFGTVGDVGGFGEVDVVTADLRQGREGGREGGRKGRVSKGLCSGMKAALL